MSQVLFSGPKPAQKCQILNWKVKEGSIVRAGHFILEYIDQDDPGGSEKKPVRFKCPSVGQVSQILVQKGSTISSGTPLLTLEPCPHPTVMNDMCAECCTDLSKLEPTSKTPSAQMVSMVHTVPGLKVNLEMAQKFGKEDEKRLLKQRRLALLVDLDQTIIHTTNDIVPPNLESVFHFQLWGQGSMWYHTRIRPFTQTFLENICKFFELHICTFGSRGYAHTIAHHLDPNQKFFSSRILSRDECFSSNSKTANLKELFPQGDHMVCIIDDREDVWNFASNLIHVKPYHFFRHTGDINAPTGLSKTDSDDKSGWDFTKEAKEAGVDAGNKQIEEEKYSSKPPSPSEEIVKDPGGIKEPTTTPEEGIKEPEPQVLEEKSTEAEIKLQTLEIEAKSDEKDAVQPEISPKEDENSSKEPTPSEISPEMPQEGEKLQVLSKPDDLKPQEESKKPEEAPKPDVIKVEDPDDYLLYLEDILKGIHKAFYDLYDETMRKGELAIPDVKNVIPYVRRKVLKGVNIVFSGVVSTHEPLEKCRPYKIAIGLGATVSPHFIPPSKDPGAEKSEPNQSTTHLVAARPGTVKVNEARRYKGIYIVTPHWLWTCNERWERADERNYPLFHKKGGNPEQMGKDSKEDETDSQKSSRTQTPTTSSSKRIAASRKTRTPSGRFMDTINPLLSFSMDEIESMGHEVDDICNESDESSSSSTFEKEVEKPMLRKKRKSSASPSPTHAPVTPTVPAPPPANAPGSKSPTKNNITVALNDGDEDSSSSSSSSSSSDSEESPDSSQEDVYGGEEVRNRKRKRLTETETEEETINAKFRRGEALPSDLEFNLTNEDTDEDGNDQEEEWMAKELERELDENSQGSLKDYFDEA